MRPGPILIDAFIGDQSFLYRVVVRCRIRSCPTFVAFSVLVTHMSSCCCRYRYRVCAETVAPVGLRPRDMKQGSAREPPLRKAEETRNSPFYGVKRRPV